MLYIYSKIKLYPCNYFIAFEILSSSPKVNSISLYFYFFSEFKKKNLLSYQLMLEKIFEKTKYLQNT